MKLNTFKQYIISRLEDIYYISGPLYEEESEFHSVKKQEYESILETLEDGEKQTIEEYFDALYHLTTCESIMIYLFAYKDCIQLMHYLGFLKN